MPLSSRASRTAAASTVGSPGSQCPPTCNHSPARGCSVSSTACRAGSSTTRAGGEVPGRAGAPHGVRAGREEAEERLAGSPSPERLPAPSRSRSRRRSRAAAAPAEPHRRRPRGRPRSPPRCRAGTGPRPGRGAARGPRDRRRAACRRPRARAPPRPGCRRACPSPDRRPRRSRRRPPPGSPACVLPYASTPPRWSVSALSPATPIAASVSPSRQAPAHRVGDDDADLDAASLPQPVAQPLRRRVRVERQQREFVACDVRRVDA